MTTSLFFILFSVIISNVNGDTFGQAVKPGYHKYAVAIFYNGSYICTGSVINSRHILTAGHCLKDKVKTLLHAIVGTVQISFSDPNPPAYSVEEVYIYPRFSYDPMYPSVPRHDIGFMKLAYPLTLGGAVESIPLSTDSSSGYQLSCQQVLFRLVQTEQGEQVMQLRRSNVVVTEREECERYYHGQVFQNQMCTLNVWKTRSPLGGDSGSPTVCNGKIFAVLNSGLTDGVHGLAKILMVAPYRSWIACVAR